MNEIIGAVLASLVGLVLPFWLRRTHRLWIRSRAERGADVAVRRIRQPDDPDLLSALELLERRIPDNERDSAETVVRWIDEAKDETERGVNKLLDYFVVAKWRGRVTGFCYAHYYLKSQLLFISFLVTDEHTSVGRRYAALTLIRYFAKELKGKALRNCKGIVFEVEHPDEASEPASRSARIARIRRFETLTRSAGIVARVVDISYLQPSLEIWSGAYSEQRLCLMYARTTKPLQDTMPRSEVAKVLKFVYDEIYGDHFEDDRRRDREFNQYLEGLHHKVVSSLPTRVRVVAFPSSPSSL